jgi:hypothetical protein
MCKFIDPKGEHFVVLHQARNGTEKTKSGRVTAALRISQHFLRRILPALLEQSRTILRAT